MNFADFDRGFGFGWKVLFRHSNCNVRVPHIVVAFHSKLDTLAVAHCGMDMPQRVCDIGHFNPKEIILELFHTRPPFLAARDDADVGTQVVPQTLDVNSREDEFNLADIIEFAIFLKIVWSVQNSGAPAAVPLWLIIHLFNS